MNRVVLVGRLANDPNFRYTASGVAVAGFTLAVDRPFKNQQGEREADFVDIVAWRSLAENCAQHLGKGRLVAIEGQLRVDSGKTKDGGFRKTVKVVAERVQFLDWAKGKSETDEVAEEPPPDEP